MVQPTIKRVRKAPAGVIAAVEEVTAVPSMYEGEYLRMGNIAVKLDEYVYRMTVEINDDIRELFPDEATFKQEVKRRLAQQMADALLEKTTFTQAVDRLNNKVRVTATACIIPDTELKRFMASTGR